MLHLVLQNGSPETPLAATGKAPAFGALVERGTRPKAVVSVKLCNLVLAADVVGPAGNAQRCPQGGQRAGLSCLVARPGRLGGWLGHPAAGLLAGRCPFGSPLGHARLVLGLLAHEALAGPRLDLGLSLGQLAQPLL